MADLLEDNVRGRKIVWKMNIQLVDKRSLEDDCEILRIYLSAEGISILYTMLVGKGIVWFFS